MLTDGFRSGVDVTLIKHPSAEGGSSGPHVMNVARSDSGNVGGMVQANIPLPIPGGGSLQATLTPDAMVGTKLSLSPPIEGLGVEVESAFGAAGVMPVGSVEVKLFRDAFTAHAVGNPGGGMIASLSTGGSALACGAALICGPQGQYGGGMLGATLGRGALNAQLTASPGYGMPHELQFSAGVPLTPSTVLGLVLEKQFGSRNAAKHVSGAAVLGYQVPSLNMFCKGLLVGGPVSSGGSFATGKFCVQKALPVGQMGISAEVPIIKGSKDDSVQFGLSLMLGM